MGEKAFRQQQIKRSKMQAQIEKTTAEIDIVFAGNPFLTDGDAKIMLTQACQLTIFNTLEGMEPEQKQLQIEMSGETEKGQWACNASYAFDWYITRRQTLKFVVDVREHGVMLSQETSLLEIISHANQKMELTLIDSHTSRRLTLEITWKQKHDTVKLDLSMNWRATNLAKVSSGFIKKTNPFLRLLKGMPNGTFMQAARTETLFDNLNPSWQQIIVPVGKLFDMALHLPFFKIQCWHEEQDKEAILVGETRFQFRLLKKDHKPQNDIFVMKNPESKEVMGNLILQDRSLLEPDSFLSFFHLGLKLTFTTAFTGSETNWAQTDWRSCIHQIIEGSWRSIQPFTEQFEGGKFFTAFGIGAKQKSTYQQNLSIVSSSSEEGNEKLADEILTQQSSQLIENVRGQEKSFFPLYKDFQISAMDTEAFLGSLHKLNGKNETYEEAVVMGPLLKQIIERANKTKNPQSYHVVLILVSKQSKDQDQVRRIISETTNSPISFLFIGLGLAEGICKSWEAIRKDTGSASGRPIMTFVNCEDESQSGIRWKKVVAQIPNHVVEYMKVVGEWSQPSSTPAMSLEE